MLYYIIMMSVNGNTSEKSNYLLCHLKGSFIMVLYEFCEMGQQTNPQSR